MFYHVQDFSVRDYFSSINFYCDICTDIKATFIFVRWYCLSVLRKAIGMNQGLVNSKRFQKTDDNNNSQTGCLWLYFPCKTLYTLMERADFIYISQNVFILE